MALQPQERVAAAPRSCSPPHSHSHSHSQSLTAEGTGKAAPSPPPPRTPHQPSGFHKPRSRRAWDIIPNRCRWRGKITFLVSAGIKPGGEKPPPRSGGAMGFATRFLGCRRPNLPVACKQGKQEEASGPRKIKVAQAKCNHQPPQTRGFREGTQVAVKP